MSTDQQIIIQAAINGILFGSLFGIMAIGISLIWGILRIANFAHLSFVLLSAYFSYELTVNYGWDPLQSILAIAPVMFIFGMAIQWVFERFKVTTFTSLLLTFGLFIVLENVMTYVWTADEISSRRDIAKDYRTAIRLPEPMDDFLVLPPDLIAFVSAIILAIGIYILLYHTQWGRAVRAMAQDPAMAQSYGVNYRLQALMLSGLATSTASVAGVIVAIKTSISPSMALTWIGIVVASVILGGLGNPIGAIIAASTLFMVESVWAVEQDPGWSRFISFSVLIFVLFIQPGTLLNMIRSRRTNRVLAAEAVDRGDAVV